MFQPASLVQLCISVSNGSAVRSSSVNQYPPTQTPAMASLTSNPMEDMMEEEEMQDRSGMGGYRRSWSNPGPDGVERPNSLRLCSGETDMVDVRACSNDFTLQLPAAFLLTPRALLERRS